MGYFVLAGIITIFAIVMLWSSSQRGSSRPNDRFAASHMKIVGLGFLVVGNLGWGILNSVYQVPTGHVSIVYSFGAITGQTGEGLQFVAPWRKVVAASTQVQSKLYKELDSFSSETQNVYVAATVNFHVSPDKIQQLYRTVGPNYAEILVDPRVYQDFKDATVRYTSIDIAPHREDIRKEVAERITKELQAQSIIVDDVLVNNISFSSEFETAIEKKQIASQNALEEAQKVEAEHQKALQAVQTATGEADSALIKAQKEAEANDVLTKSITPELIQYLTVQKLSPNVSVMMIPTGNQFILGADLLKPALNK